jgi:hypothetical protein
MNNPAQAYKLSQSGAVSRKVIFWLAIPFVVAVSFFCVRWTAQQKYRRARAEWKAATLPRLAGLSITNENISRDLELIKTQRPRGEFQDWIGDNVLLMTNGEYLIYAFRHGFNNGFVDHLLLAHGPGDRWLYSTYHFCNHMAGIRGDDPPGSIAEFAKKYAAREFDGKSDVCLKKTWP